MPSDSAATSSANRTCARSVSLASACSILLDTISQRLQSGTMCEELVSRSIELPGGELSVLQPREAAELPDAGAVEWAPLAPYWAVLWRSGVALARELDGLPLRGLRVVELGCGLAVPSIAALLSLLPCLAPEAWLADPGRPAAVTFLEQARRRWPLETRVRGVVQLH